MFTLEKTLTLATKTSSRLKAILPLAAQAKGDPHCRSRFISAYKIASQLYHDLQSADQQTLVDESSEDWSKLCQLMADIDLIFIDIDSAYQVVVETTAEPKNESALSNSGSIHGSHESLNSNKSSKHSPNVKLPRISLQTFEGDLQLWPTYYDLFRSLIDQNDTLSDVEKFQYLISTLSREPLALVRHIPLTADNYRIAFNSLIDRYQNSRVLATHYWKAIANAPKTSSNSAKSLRELLNVFNENVAALDQLKKVDYWDFTLFNWLLQKLDDSSRERFEITVAGTDIPTFGQLKQFLSNQCQALEASSWNKSSSSNIDKSSVAKSALKIEAKKSSFIATSARSSSQTCEYCDKDHKIFHCQSFLNLSPFKRHEAAKRFRLCLNCFKSTHSLASCQSSTNCRYCAGRHNSLLHFPPKENQPFHSEKPQPKSLSSDASASNRQNSSVSSVEPSTPRSRTSVAIHEQPHTMSSFRSAHPLRHTVLLATIRLQIKDKWGNYQIVRALCDSGSQTSFLTEPCRKRLGLVVNRTSIPISCLGHVTLKSSQGSTICTIRPVDSSKHQFTLNTIVLSNICQKLPTLELTPHPSLDRLKLADPNWFKPGVIDMLLGADIFPEILQQGILPGNSECPSAIDTIFGWILLGTISSNTTKVVQSFFSSCEPTVEDTIKAFWQLEEINSKEISSPEDKQAEESFVTSHFRDLTGRFGVTLPFKNPMSTPIFPNMLKIADRRLLSLERHLMSNLSLHESYISFMKDYLDAGHMSLLSDPIKDSQCYFIPHHCVMKRDADLSKIRVVFDASAKASNGASLNDHLLVGPKLQSDIVAVLLRFRLNKFVFSCDVRQMYRQILVDNSHHKYQLIRWRFSTKEPIQTYRLNTVTYGIVSSPFLAIRSILQLAKENEIDFPLAAQAIQSDLYVDDFATGADDLESTLALRNQLISLLKLGQFELRKWAASHRRLLEYIPDDHCQLGSSSFDATDISIKVLGLQWQSNTDSFCFAVKVVDSPCTKRAILSEISRIYDPLGFLCPLTFFAKRLIQQLWLLGLDWDGQPPDHIRSKWQQYKVALPKLVELRIPRCVKPQSFEFCQLHAFCDASELGYGSVAYLRFIGENGDIQVSLIMAKSKVAPIKPVSIPRLELCAASLLSDLVVYIIENSSVKLVIDQIFAWSDSTVALSWIKSSPHKWKTFVANRVVHIQERVPPQSWRHIRSADNPADFVSRGLLPEEILSCSLWWAGPNWLKSSQDLWPSQPQCFVLPDEMPREHRNVVLVSQVGISEIDQLLYQFSSLRKITGIIAYCRRFGHCSVEKGTLVATELHQALMCVVKHVQLDVFITDYNNLRQGLPCSKLLFRLSPFIDTYGILRVGGRLFHAGLSFETKHPALLPKYHRLTELLIQQIHQQHLHPGVNTTMYLLQQNFWIIAGRKSIRHYLSKCYRCFRSKPRSLQPPMGNLPLSRVSQLKPFSCVGVDYAGPFPLLMSRHRGNRTTKAYLCLFICFTTRAMHLEVASDLSSDAFLAALRRFVSRRGRCSQIYSDCGTNFVGAAKQLNTYMQAATNAEAIKWHFNPPSSPHFGGLWESGVKSVKTHIVRVLGNQILTYEEFNTFVIQVEAVLNSRPLCELSSDANDLRVLSPGHFLTLEPLSSVPDPDLLHLKLSHLSRWQLVQHLHQSLWKRWRNEYLHNFYQRSRWAKTHRFTPIDVGALVLIKDELTPPLMWPLGRIIKIHPGHDGITRVASVRTAKGIFKRPVVKLCPVPVLDPHRTTCK